jgi:hypothetical protein
LDDFLGEAGQQHIHVFKPWQRGAEIIVFNVHHHHGGVLGGEGVVINILNVVIYAVEVATLPE